MAENKQSIVEPLRKPVQCPTCSQASDRKFYPFCSKRCQDVDLHHWFSGSYSLASSEPFDGSEES